jgi:hypothetical protein
MLLKGAGALFASAALTGASAFAFATPALAQGSPVGGAAGLDAFQKGYFAALAAALFAIWFFKVRPARRDGLWGWAAAIALVGGFVGAIVAVVKLAGH